MTLSSNLELETNQTTIIHPCKIHYNNWQDCIMIKDYNKLCVCWMNVCAIMSPI